MIFDPKNSSVRDIDLIKIDFEINSANSSSLVILNDIHFSLKRIFILTTLDNEAIRGEHAHRNCTQIFGLMIGQSSISLFDAEEERSIPMGLNGPFIKVPPGLWISVSLAANTKVIVLCDQQYDENEYIRDWQEFMAWKI